VRKTAVVIPDRVEITASLAPEIRARGIYEALVWTADVRVAGAFPRPDLRALDRDLVEILWDEASVAVGLTESRRLKAVSRLEIAGGECEFQPGGLDDRMAGQGFSAPCDLSGDAALEFSLGLSFAGSEAFLAASPAAAEARLTVRSEWPHPSFVGDLLPDARDVKEHGFSASWTVPAPVRTSPRVADLAGLPREDGSGRYAPGRDSGCVAIAEHRCAQRSGPYSEPTLGVNLLAGPGDRYALSGRATRYAVFFIALAFACYLALEGRSREGEGRLHIAQLAVCALSLTLFHLVLLALAEHVPFGAAFAGAAALTVSMISGYVLLSVRRAGNAAAMAVTLSVLYGMLYVILNLEDWALAAGTALLVIAVGALMASTRNIADPGAPATRGPSADPAAPEGPADEGGCGPGDPAAPAGRGAPECQAGLGTGGAEPGAA
jgi:inner membrane protein